jgi:hypothetical protein
MSWNGTDGVFLSDEEYDQLVNGHDTEYVDELETEVHNHRNTLDEAHAAAYDLYKLLDNAR